MLSSPSLLRSKDPDRYYREHDTKLTLFYAAEHVLNDKFGIIPSKMNYHTMTDGYSLMEDKKSGSYIYMETSRNGLKES